MTAPALTPLVSATACLGSSRSARSPSRLWLTLLASALSLAIPITAARAAGANPHSADTAAPDDTAGWIGRVTGTAYWHRDGAETVVTARDYLAEIKGRDEFRCDPNGSIDILTLNGAKERWTNDGWRRVQPLPPVALVDPQGALGSSGKPAPFGDMSRKLGTGPSVAAARPAHDLATPTVVLARLVRTRAGANGIRRPIDRALALENLDDLVILWTAGEPSARVRIVIADDGGGVLVRHDGCPNTGRYELSPADRAALRGEIGRRLELKLALKSPGAAVETMTTTFALRDPARVAALLTEIQAPVPGWPPELADVIRASRLVQAGLLDKAREFLVRAQETESGRQSAVVQDLLERVDTLLEGSDPAPLP